MKKDLPVLDLHGVAHRDVLSELYEFYFWEGNGDSIIITGKSQKMKDIVIDWLEDNDYVYNIPFNNDGRIMVHERLV